MFTPLEIVGDTSRGSTDQKVRGSNPFERARHFPQSNQVADYLDLRQAEKLLTEPECGFCDHGYG
jgi:hypothetical protein